MRELIITRCKEMMGARINRFGYWMMKFEQFTDYPKFDIMSDEEILLIYEYLYFMDSRAMA